MTREHDRPTSTDHKRAFAYLRVSSAGQVNTDYDPEGISLPAQRAAIQRRAAELNADIVAEFVEPGRSATTTDRRPEFQRMMARLKAEGGIDYVIVYARSRLHRNSIDAAITKRDLRKAGAAIVSVMDYTEDTAVGDLVATVLDAVNEYQSRASGADIAYKMGQKIMRGGSVGKAPIGYLNVRERFDGREIRTIAVDPERGPLVRMAFELYATGTYGFHALIEALTDAGLRTRPTRRYLKGTPISINALGNLLRDRYYLGYVTYRGEEYRGRHEPLVTPETFDRVQQVLLERRAGGTRERTHHHYLKGVVWCHRCKRRLMIMRGKSHTGALYFYYFCRARREGTCDLPYLPIGDVDTAVLDNYATVTLPADLCQTVMTRMNEALTDWSATSRELRKRTKTQLAKLDALEDRFLDLIGDPDWPQAKIADRLRTIRQDRERLAKQLDEAADDPEAHAGRETLAHLVELLSDPQEMYRQADRRHRQALNRCFFTKLFLDVEGDQVYVAADELAGPVEALVSVARDPHNESGGTTGGGTAALLRSALFGQGSNNAAWVEVPGIEPGSSVALPGLLRAQLAVSLLGPTDHASESV